MALDFDRSLFHWVIGILLRRGWTQILAAPEEEFVVDLALWEVGVSVAPWQEPWRQARTSAGLAALGPGQADGYWQYMQRYAVAAPAMAALIERDRTIESYVPVVGLDLDQLILRYAIEWDAGLAPYRTSLGEGWRAEDVALAQLGQMLPPAHRYWEPYLARREYNPRL